MLVLDSLLLGGLRFVLEQLATAAQAEAQDHSALRARLLEAQARLELGGLTQDGFAEVERDLIAAMWRIRGRPRAPISMSREDTDGAVEIESFEPDR